MASASEQQGIGKGNPARLAWSNSWPPADPEIAQAAAGAMADGSWGRYEGSHGKGLAERLRELHDVDHVMLCCSGTVAVELALRGLGVRPGDEVVLAGYDFAGNFSAILAIGATPVLVDVDPRNWNLSVAACREAIGPATKAIIASHLHGGMVPMRELSDVAASVGVPIVEDACQSPAARVDGRLAGCWGDVGVWSFGGSKLLTAGRGGAVFTSRADVMQRIKLYCQRGNHAFPLSELQAAVLNPQMRRLEERNQKRASAVRFLQQRLRQTSGIEPFVNHAGAEQPGYYKLGLKFRAEQSDSVDRAAFVAALREAGVPIAAGFRSFVDRSARRCRKVGPLDESCSAGEGALVLHHPVLLEPEASLASLADTITSVANTMFQTARK